MSHSFIHESFNSSVDFPTYIPWQTLSSDVSDKLKHGSIRITRSNKVEYATIQEEGERVPLLDEHRDNLKVETPAVRQGVTWAVAAFLLVNSALGAGVLNIPAAFEKAGGIWVTCLLQLLMMFLLGSTMLVLAYCSDLNQCSTYHDVLLTMCGRRAQQLSAFSILMTCYGICITFLIIIGDQYDRIFASVQGPDYCHSWYMNKHFTISATAILLILPMCYFQRLDFLRYASSLGIFAMVYPVLLTVYEYFMIGNTNVELKTSPDSFISLLTVIPMISFAYQTHEIVVPVYACMSNRNIWDFSKATALAMFFLFVVYTIAGTFGYWTFGSMVPQDIMQLYNARDPIVMVGILALILKMITTYPPIVVCGRGAVDGLYAEICHLTADQFIAGEKFRRYLITSVWFVTTLFLSIYTPNIGVAIELLGCLAFFNVFIFPGCCLISLVTRKQDGWGWKGPALLLLAAIMITLGAFVFGVVLIQVIMNDVIGGESPPHLLCSA